jgi:hypothetical protein
LCYYLDSISRSLTRDLSLACPIVSAPTTLILLPTFRKKSN